MGSPRIAGLALMLGVGALVCLPADAYSASLRARPAAAFIGSVGVNVHMSYSDKAYRDARKVLRALRRLRIRHVRDGVMPGRPDQYEALRLLARHGIRTTLIAGDPTGRFVTLDESLPIVRGPLRSAVEALESANEHDRTHRADWPSELRSFQRRLAARAPGRLPVLAPALSRISSFRRLGRLPRRQVDRGNIHPYPGGEPPDRPGFIQGEIRLARRLSGTDPVWATESGYHTGVGEQPGVSERAAAIYTPRILLTNFAAGIRRTYLYELLDQAERRSDTSQDDRFGLLRASFAEKPAGRAVRRLIAVFGKSRRRCRGSVRVRIASAPTDLRTVALRRCDGTRFIALWRATRVYDTARGRNLRVRTYRIRLRFSRRIAGARLHSPNGRGRARRLRAGRAFGIRIGPAVRVLQLPR